VKLSPRIFAGTAGWSIPRASAPRCPGEGSHLARYARTFGGAEINSSFYRPHPATTYAKWAAATPASFRFAVKVPRAITHEQALRRPRQPLRRFLEETSGLGKKRGPLLVQLPPSHAFDTRVATRFFETVRELYGGPVVCEPRHVSWFTLPVERLLEGFHVARVAADPARVPQAGLPGGWRGLAYYRLHGSPRTYWSRYDGEYIAGLAQGLRDKAVARETWCIFDNTASGAALENAFELQQVLGA
jgi:uncharacterized protein YecE (DUF72 family)